MLQMLFNVILCSFADFHMETLKSIRNLCYFTLELLTSYLFNSINFICLAPNHKKVIFSSSSLLLLQIIDKLSGDFCLG